MRWTIAVLTLVVFFLVSGCVYDRVTAKTEKATGIIFRHNYSEAYSYPTWIVTDGSSGQGMWITNYMPESFSLSVSVGDESVNIGVSRETYEAIRDGDSVNLARYVGGFFKTKYLWAIQ